MQEYFIAVDGDNIGSHLEYYAITNNVEALKEFSKIFNSVMDWFEEELIKSFDVSMIFYGGDNLLASTSSDKFAKEALEELRQKFFNLSGSTLSIGLGKSPQQAYLALKLAKTNGKNVIREFSELQNG